MGRKRNHLLKKSTAVMTASAMVMAAAVPVMAEGAAASYCEREKAALAELCETLPESWDADLAQTKEQQANNVNMNMTLTLDDAGRSMVAMMAGMDVSWMNNLGMNMQAGISEEQEAVLAELFVNDSTVCTMNVLMDFLTATEYVQVPELTQGWLKAALTEVESQAGVSVDSEASSDSLKILGGVASDPTVILPDGQEAADLVNRYGSIILAHMKDGASVEEAVSVEGISEDCTLLEGQLVQEDAKEMVKELLTTAQEDEQFQGLLTKWSENLTDGENLNEEFKKFAEETLASLDEPEAEGEDSGSDTYLVSRIWVNGEDKIVGREFGVCEGIDTQTSFTWKAPKSEESDALLLDMTSEGSSVTLTGSSTADGKGSYSVAMDGVTALEIASESGTPVSVYTITFPQGESEENYNPLSLFSLVLTVNDESETTGDINLAILNSGAQLGSLNIRVEAAGDMVELPSEEEMETVYDMASEEDMAAYNEVINADTIFANLEKAGVPAELVAALQQSMETDQAGAAAEVPGEADAQAAEEVPAAEETEAEPAA